MIQAAFDLQLALDVAELEHREHGFHTFEHDACLVLASLLINRGATPLQRLHFCLLMQRKKPAVHAYESNRKRAESHQLWCKLSIKLHGQCNVCEGSQSQYRDLPRVRSDHVSDEGGSWCLYCYALQSQSMHSP